MDLNSLRNSFKSKHFRKLSSGERGATATTSNHEEQPILPRNHQPSQEIPPQSATGAVDSSTDHSDVVLKVDAASGGDSRSSTASVVVVAAARAQRDPSFDLSEHVQQPDSEDLTPRLNGAARLLTKQASSIGEISLDIEADMDELRRVSRERILTPSPRSYSRQSSRDNQISLGPSVSDGIDTASALVRRRYKELSEPNEQTEIRDEVVRCTSNASFQSQTSFLTRTKPKSRLTDPSPDVIERLSGMIPRSSSPLRSGMLSKGSDYEEDDPLESEDFPDKYKKSHVSKWTVFQWISSVAIVGGLACSLALPALREMTCLQEELWKWLVLLLFAFCGRLVSGWGIRVIVFLIERSFLLRKRVLYFVYGLRRGVENCLWLGLVLILWHYMFDMKIESGNFLSILTKILVCFLVGNIVWLIKTLMVKVLASSFHVSAYFDRIQESLFNQYVIETLSGPPLIELGRMEVEAETTADEIRKLQNAGATIPPDLKADAFPPRKKEELRRCSRGKSFKFSGQLGDDGITIDHLHKLNPKNVSAWNMKRLIKIVKNCSITTLDEHAEGAATAEDESSTQIKSEHEAKAAARKIFYNVARPGSRFIYLQDLMRFMREDEALKTMNSFEGASENCRICKSSLKNWVVNVFRERRALALTLNDTKTAVNKLHHMVNIMVAIIIGIIWLLLLEIAPTKIFVVLGSQIFLVTVFGNTLRTLFECLVFLFCVHPFDVGDRCEVDGEELMVEEMNILTTIFLRSKDNQKVVYYNSVLASKSIGNFYRSPDMFEEIEFYVHLSTPAEKIALIKQRIMSFIETKKEHWDPKSIIEFKGIEELNSVKMAVWLTHRMNLQDKEESYGRRALLVEEMAKIFRELDIQHRLHPLDINIRSMPPWNTYSAP